ncbi:MAG: TonB-dependent receptor, partial [Rhodoferax sp.]|nr:TonB-dependent receptor [Rhodoferax sp.]
GLALPVFSAQELTKLSLEQLMALSVVSASKYQQTQTEVPAAVSIITRDEIRSFGWRTLDQALASLPGIHNVYDFQYSYLGTRGFGIPGDYNSRVLIAINGNRVNDPVYDLGPIGENFPLDLSLVERIEFIPGPGGAVYGQNAMFGVVNVITRTGTDVNGGDLSVGWQNLQRTSDVGVTLGRRLSPGVELLLALSATRAKGEDRFFEYGASGLSGVANGMDGGSNDRLFAHLGRGPWSFNLISSDRRKDDPTGSYLTDPLVPGQTSADTYLLTDLRYQGDLRDDGLQLQARIFVNRYRYGSRSSYGTFFETPAAGDWRGGEMRLLWTRFAGHKWMIGMELQENTRIDQASIDLDHPTNSVWIARTGSRAGVYVQDEWRVSRVLTTTLGLRLDRSDQSRNAPSLRAALIWQPSYGTSLKLLYGGAQRAPNAFERDYAGGVAQVANPGLQGEKMETLEWVLDHRVGNDLNLRASVYHWRLSDLITLGVDEASAMTQYQSGTAMRAEGLELSADKTWQGGSRLRGSLSLQFVRQALGVDMVNSPRQLFKLLLSTPLPAAGLRLGYELQAESQRLTLRGHALGGYAVSHLHLSNSTWMHGMELSMGIRNLFDKRYDEPGADTHWQDALQQRGRSVGVQANFHF